MLRNKFDDVRFIVPNVAKSAATMLTMSGNEVLMDGNAELGPVDPQLVFRKGDGSIVQAPAQAIVDQFDEAQALIGKDPSKLPAWLPILQQYGPSLYKEARNAIELSVKLVEEWLAMYMFAGQPDGPQKAKDIAGFLGDHNQFKSHGRRIGRKVLQDRGANIKNLESDKGLHDRVLDLYYAIIHTFNGACFKMFENSRGQAQFRIISRLRFPRSRRNSSSHSFPARDNLPPDRSPRSPHRRSHSACATHHSWILRVLRRHRRSPRWAAAGRTRVCKPSCESSTVAFAEQACGLRRGMSPPQVTSARTCAPGRSWGLTRSRAEWTSLLLPASPAHHPMRR